MQILSAFLVITILGLLLGFGLSVAAKKLEVKKDEKLIALEAIMPNANCGACGYAGCSAYAEAVANGEAEIGKCTVGGAKTSAQMSEIMGVEVANTGDAKKLVAQVFCRGNCEATNKDFDYEGVDDCVAASILFNGDLTCKEGCLHLGSCIKVCPVGALSFDENKDIQVDRDLCIACGKCVDICPHNVIKLTDDDAEWIVKCNNHENGGKVRKECKNGCIGCKICERKFPESGCTVDNFLSSFDNDKPHTQIEAAAAACPSKCIVKRK